MIREIAVVTVSILVAGCSATQVVDGPATGQVITECAGANGPDIKIRYGDSMISVTNKVSANSDGKLVIKLHPDSSSDQGIDYKTLDIALIGKDAKSNWLSRTLNASEQKTMKATICVDGKSEGDYEYMVVVPGVGTIDPRVEIKN